MTNLPLNASVEEILASDEVKPDSVGSKRLVLNPDDHFAITEPGQYRTRSGQAATIVMNFARNAIGYVEDNGRGNRHGWIWWLSGRAHRDNASHDYDIVGEA